MTEEVKHKKSTQGSIPRREADLIDIARNVGKVWHESQLTLRWITVEEAFQSLDLFESSYSDNNKVKGSRVALTQELAIIDTEIDISVRHVKGYIDELYSVKEARAYYPQFGIMKNNRGYRMPADQDRRLHALGSMIDALEYHGLSDKKYGKGYWTGIRDKFMNAKTEATKKDSAVAGFVNIKTEQKAIIIKVLNSLIMLIKANYPDTWKEELRVWGFRKEKY